MTVSLDFRWDMEDGVIVEHDESLMRSLTELSTEQLIHLAHFLSQEGCEDRYHIGLKPKTWWPYLEDQFIQRGYANSHKEAGVLLDKHLSSGENYSLQYI